jgi:hypothetical protein
MNISELNDYCKKNNKSIVVHKGLHVGFKSNRRFISFNIKDVLSVEIDLNKFERGF